MIAATASAKTWTLEGDGYKAVENNTVPKVTTNKFWLEATMDEENAEFVLTSTMKLVLESPLTYTWTGVRIELCFGLASDLFYCHMVDAWWNNGTTYNDTIFLYEFDYRPNASDLYTANDKFQWPNSTYVYGLQ